MAAKRAASVAVPNTAAQTLPGYAAFPNLDPAIIGDVSLQGTVNSTDAGGLLQEMGGSARFTIPYAPVALTETPRSTLAVESQGPVRQTGPTAVQAVEQVFGSLEHGNEFSDVSANPVHDLAAFQGPLGPDQAAWLPEDWSTPLGPTARQGLAGSTLADT
jgi:hypothetical protein